MSRLGFSSFCQPYFFFFADFSALPIRQRLLASFQAVTPRTAGFNTVNLSAMSSASYGMMILLMLIGGSPGSTAGGMKTTTLAVLINAAATFRRQDSAQFCGRRIVSSRQNRRNHPDDVPCAVLWGRVFIYMRIFRPPCLYEAASAVGTVGSDIGYYAAAAYSLANGIDRADVSGQSRRAYTHLCGGVQ